MSEDEKQADAAKMWRYITTNAPVEGVLVKVDGRGITSITWGNSSAAECLELREKNLELIAALEKCCTNRAGYAITKSAQYEEVISDMWRDIERIDGIARAAIAKALGS